MDERTPERDLEVVCSTYLALAAGAVATAAVAVLLNPKGKLSLVRYPTRNEHRVRLSNEVIINQLFSDPDAFMHPRWGSCCRRFLVSCSSALGSHDDRIFCCRPLSRWISISQGLDPPVDKSTWSRPRSPHDIPHLVFQVHRLLADQCQYTCNVFSRHGIPGLLGWVAHLFLQITDCEDRTV